MYLANQPLGVLGLPNAMGDRAMNSYTWPVISKTPWMALGVASFLVGTQFIISRRMQLAAESKASPEDEPDGSAEDSEAKGDDR